MPLDDDDVYEEDDPEVAEGDAVDDDDEGARRGDEEEEEDDEGQDEYEKDGFIVDDDEDEEQDEEDEGKGSDEERHRKKRKKKRESEKNYVLDEDDYELLQDNNITGFHRPKPGSKKFKRLKKAGRDMEEDMRSGFSDGEDPDRAGEGGRTAEEKLKYRLFGDDESAPLEDIAEEEQQEEEDVDIGEDDEMADFIVDEEDVDEDGTIIRKKKLKKKKVRPAGGVSSSALQEAHDIFGDVDELLTLRKKGLERAGDAGAFGEKRLEDEFEPQIIEKNYMTAKDDLIRDADIPERIQLSEDVTGLPPLDDKSIKDEATWIYNQLTSDGVSAYFGERAHDIDKEDIANVLLMLHIQRFDIPFIAMYRKELCLSLLKDPEQDHDNADDTPKLKWHKLLWAIQNLDVKWLVIQKRKSALHSYYGKRFDEESRRIDDVSRLARNHNLFKAIIDSLHESSSEREIDDVDLKFNLHFPPGEVDVDEGQFKRPKRKSLYSICCKAGLWEVANKFGRSSEQLGLSLLTRMGVEDLEDAKEIPEEIAANFTCAMFEKPEDVLKGARHMAAVEISCEPNIRKHVRSIFMKNAIISTSPTAEGDLIIDEFHQLSKVKWLKDKPIPQFVDSEWLLIQKAEEEKLLKVSISLPDLFKKPIMNESREVYLSLFVSKTAKLWNEQREMILNDAFFNLLLPSMEKEARLLLSARAKNKVLMDYGKKLWNKISVAPYRHKDNAIVSEEGSMDSMPRVMACCWGPGKPTTTFVMLDSAGEVLDVLYAGSISVRSQGLGEQRKKNDQQRLLKFMTDHQPNVICVGATNIACRTLKDEINEIIFKILEDHPRDVGSDFELVPVFGDESLPRLFENSRISSDQLPGQPGIVKRAVSLGRFLQNPLATVATLCGLEREILSWKLSPLEHFLTPDEKYEMVEQVMVDATNQIGIDVNMACSHEWLFSPLQFISGFGPRKASALQRALVRAGSIFSRKEITMGILKKRVFINSAGFLRIRRSGAASTSSHIIDLLDDTRIHPESYDLAKNMAKEVYIAYEEINPDDVDEDTLEMAIEQVREKALRSKLEALKINDYAGSVEQELGCRKRETLYDIKQELLHGYQDWRIPYTEPDPDEEFQMISGETDETISEGRIVQVSVRFVQESRIICNFDSGLKGFISIQDFSDQQLDPSELQEMVHEGDILTCKIKSIQKPRCLVYLTCKESDLRRRYQSKDYGEYYEKGHTVIHNKRDSTPKGDKKTKKPIKARMIVHPRFKNFTCDEAEKFLSEKETGESIIHPSTKGPSFLTLTLKIYDGVYAHKEIVESNKDHKDITSLLRIGKKLTIGDETFEDLDELMDRYVDPLVAHLKNMLGYRKFRAGKIEEIDNLLRAEKAENPMRIVYCFSIAHKYPGSFVLTYIRSSNPHHEYIGLYPKGFKFRKREFEDIDRLISYFQRHIDEVPVPSNASVAAVVPMASPASDRWRGNMNSDRERSSTPRTGGRFDQRNGNGRDGHPSGAPRPYGRGRGRGRGNNSSHDGQDSGYGGPKWGSRGNDDDGLSSFPGAKVQNSPGRERFPGSWGGGGSGGGGGGGGSWDGGGSGGSNGGGGGGSGGGSWDGGGSGGGNGGGGSWGGGGSGGADLGGSGSWGGGGDGSNDGNRGSFGDGGGGGKRGSWDNSSKSWDAAAATGRDGPNASSNAGNAGWDNSAKLVPPTEGSSGGWSGGGGDW